MRLLYTKLERALKSSTSETAFAMLTLSSSADIIASSSHCESTVNSVMWNMPPTLQGAATPRQSTPNQNQSSQDLQQAARDLREAIRNNVNQELIAAKSQAVAQAAAAQAARGGPTPPPVPGDLVIRRPDGN